MDTNEEKNNLACFSVDRVGHEVDMGKSACRCVDRCFVGCWIPQRVAIMRVWFIGDVLALYPTRRVRQIFG